MQLIVNREDRLGWGSTPSRPNLCLGPGLASTHARARARTREPGGIAQVLQVFRATGGVVSGDTLALLLRERSDQPISLVARWIVDRRVISFVCRAQRLLPIFQFEQPEFTIQAGVRQVILELSDVFGDMELAEWFARPNSCLSGQSPADAIRKDALAVVQAARTDRFVALG